jgi:hypothetical protein
MRRAFSITETSKEQPSVREGKFQSGESGRMIQDDFCIFSHEAHIHEYVDNQSFMVSLSLFYTFLTINQAPPSPFLRPMFGRLALPRGSFPSPDRLLSLTFPTFRPCRFNPGPLDQAGPSVGAYRLGGYASIISSRPARSLQCRHALPHAPRRAVPRCFRDSRR